MDEPEPYPTAKGVEDAIKAAARKEDRTGQRRLGGSRERQRCAIASRPLRLQPCCLKYSLSTPCSRR